MDNLTPEQQTWVKERVVEWLTLKFKHERVQWYETGKPMKDLSWEEAFPTLPTRLTMDAIHSALLARLLNGRPALPEPPTRQYGYPDYGDAE